MTTIHLLGSEGFIGRAVQREAGGLQLHCWSHRELDPEHHFDLLDPSSWQALLKCQPTHAILLSWPGLPNYQELFHVNRNLPACIELIEQLVDAGLQRLLVAGTCYEYGLQNGPMSEDQFTDPVNCYAIAKDSLRRVIASRYSQQDLQWCWTRIFYPFGQGQNPHSLIPSLQKALESGEKSFPMGSGRQLRDFIDVQEVARQLLTLVMHQDAGGIYNTGSGIPRSVLEMAEEAIAAHGGSIRLKRAVYPDRSDEPLAFWAHMDKFKALLRIPETIP
ncbi:NAD(P)-dependent oxidoreductase [Synechococcus sp. CCY9201]|uniref:NAD-dependent epimerase/dehydratase family protein n=1 Tax=Synechococcus sp. CCY9201 TaxID=174697 RepID=UPI002B1EA24C|nr:NAD(P)-dependent oxidoreductase [Synechococcus sp. CCY9201]MEA5474672.1 NAD(P)-dependent oxidoreductase [Synechococcus sp. CCY9201]